MGSQTDVYDLAELLATDMRTELPAHAVTSITSKPPFVAVGGLYNVRDLGSASVRPGFAYRSGASTEISEEGKAALRALGIRAIFDLRNPGERTKQPSPAIEGIETVWEPYTQEPSRTNPADFAKEEGGVSGFVAMYTQILEILTPIFMKIFEHIRDRPQQPFLFHCSAGKDRTGVLAALIHLLVETPSDAIVHDYLLTRVGAEPGRKMILGPLLHATGPAGLDNTGLRNICGVHPGTMIAFVEAVEENYGGVKAYLTKKLGLSQDDVATIILHLKSTP